MGKGGAHVDPYRFVAHLASRIASDHGSGRWEEITMVQPTSNAIRSLSHIACATGLIFTAFPATAQQLYDTEQAVELAGYPAVTYFQQGEADKPLIVFVPGAHHAARIAYGGHEGARSEDFLAHWLKEKGYNFLAVSYPIDTESGMMEATAPDFTAQDWGRQIAEAAASTIEEHGLNGEIYIAHWSMAGKVIQPAHAALREAGHTVSASFSFAATPGIPGIITLTQELDKTEDGYANRESTYPGWIAQIAANQGDGDPIIPEDVFRSEYLGHIPVNLQGYGEVVSSGEVQIDHMQQAVDYGAFEFADHPWIVVFQVDARADARHAINDSAYWSLYNTHTLFAELAERDLSVNDLSDETWLDMIAMSQELPERLRVEVGGNHFFFVGEEGARATADAIDRAIAQVAELKADIDKLLAE